MGKARCPCKNIVIEVTSSKVFISLSFLAPKRDSVEKQFVTDLSHLSRFKRAFKFRMVTILQVRLHLHPDLASFPWFGERLLAHSTRSEGEKILSISGRKYHPAMQSSPLWILSSSQTFHKDKQTSSSSTCITSITTTHCSRRLQDRWCCKWLLRQSTTACTKVSKSS